jgi:hypothetical protein
VQDWRAKIGGGAFGDLDLAEQVTVAVVLVKAFSWIDEGEGHQELRDNDLDGEVANLEVNGLVGAVIARSDIVSAGLIELSVQGFDNESDIVSGQAGQDTSGIEESDLWISVWALGGGTSVGEGHASEEDTVIWDSEFWVDKHVHCHQWGLELVGVDTAKQQLALSRVEVVEPETEGRAIDEAGIGQGVGQTGDLETSADEVGGLLSKRTNTGDTGKLDRVSENDLFGGVCESEVLDGGASDGEDVGSDSSVGTFVSATVENLELGICVDLFVGGRGLGVV